MAQIRTFLLLKPAWELVGIEGSVENVRNLRMKIEKVVDIEEKAHKGEAHESSINDLKEHLVFPVIHILKSGMKCSWSMQEELVRVLSVVLGHSIITNYTFFQELFMWLTHIIANQTDQVKVADLSEECKQTALEALSSLIENSADPVKEQMCENAFRPLLGHSIYLILRLAQDEKNRNLKIQAMETLSSLGLQKSFPSLATKQQKILSHMFVNFLPGIVSTLGKIATDDEKQGHKVTAHAIETWGYFVMLVMRDSFLEEYASGLGRSKTEIQLQKLLFGEEGFEGSTIGKLPTEENEFVIPELEEKVAFPRTEVSEKWIQNTADRLIVMVSAISKLVTHSHWRVRLALVQWAQRLICNCYRSLTGAIVMAVEVIVTLRSDSLVDVETSAQNALLAVTQVLEGSGQNAQSKQGLLELLEERVYALSTQMPTLCCLQDDAKTLASVQLLFGCLEVLGERIAQLMTSRSHSQRLLESLSFVLTVDTSDSNLLLEKPSSQGPGEVLIVKPLLERRFKHFQDMQILETVGSICHLIGYYGNVIAPIDRCLDHLQISTHHQKETLLLLTLIIQGRDQRRLKEKNRSNSREENEQVVQNVLDVMLCQEVFNAPLAVSSPSVAGNIEDLSISGNPVAKEKVISVDLVKNNVVLVASALRLIGACARMMGADFKIFLSKVLCPVMEKAGESNASVSHAASNTLRDIAESCEYESIGELIEKSVPQFWYPLSMRLKRLPEYPSAPLVLQVCLEYVNIDIMPFTEELVEEVLACLDAYHCDRALPLLRVLLVYVSAVIKYESKTRALKEAAVAGSDNCECRGNSEDAGRTELKQEETPDGAVCDNRGLIARFLENYHRNKVCIRQGFKAGDIVDSTQETSGREYFQNCVREQDTDDMMEDNTEESGEKKEAPRYIKLIVNIMERCSYLLYSEDRKMKLLLMEVAKAGCEALAQWEDQRLPVLHKLWKPLLLRFKDPDLVVMVCSLEVLSAMLVASGEFLRARTLREVFPALISYLRKQADTSLGKTKRSGYYMTAEYNSQHKMLLRLTDMIPPLMMGAREMAQLVDVVILYLDTRQPDELCKAGITLVRKIAESHPHHVWLALAYQQAPMILIPPSPDLSPIKIMGADRKTLPSEVLDLYRELS